MSNNLISILIKIFSWTMMGISVLLTILFYMGVITENPFIIWAYILTAIAAVLAVVFPVLLFAMYPKNAIKALIAILILGGVLVFGYIFADSTPIVTSVTNADFSNPNVLVYSDMGIISTYILFGISLLILVFTGIKGIFNR